MNNIQCRVLSDFTDDALYPLNDIENEIQQIESILNNRETYDDYEYFKADIISELIDIKKYIEEIRERF